MIRRFLILVGGIALVPCLRGVLGGLAVAQQPEQAPSRAAERPPGADHITSPTVSGGEGEKETVPERTRDPCDINKNLPRCKESAPR
jgi:hypothetical protein